MLEKALAAVEPLAHRLLAGWDGLREVDLALRAALLGYLVGTGVPSDEAVRSVEEWVAAGVVRPAQPNPLYAGLPWFVPGPVAGAPYYPRGG